MAKPSGPDSNFSFWLGFVGGAILAFAVVCFWLAFAEISSVTTATEWLNKWQTLVAAMLALLGAVLTVVAIQRQIHTQIRLEDERRERQNFAVRSAMPEALSELTEYLDKYLRAFRTVVAPPLGEGPIRHDENWVSPPIPEVPRRALEVLQNCIEPAGRAAMPIISGVIADFQLHDSRLHKLVEEVSHRSEVAVTPHNVVDQLVSVLEHYVRCRSMFPYARRETEALSERVARGEVATRAFFANFEDDDYPGLDQMIERRYPVQV